MTMRSNFSELSSGLVLEGPEMQLENREELDVNPGHHPRRTRAPSVPRCRAAPPRRGPSGRPTPSMPSRRYRPPLPSLPLVKTAPRGSHRPRRRRTFRERAARRPAAQFPCSLCTAAFAPARRQHRHRRLQHLRPPAPRAAAAPGQPRAPPGQPLASCKLSIASSVTRSSSRTPPSSASKISSKWSAKPPTATPWSSRS